MVRDLDRYPVLLVNMPPRKRLRAPTPNNNNNNGDNNNDNDNDCDDQDRSYRGDDNERDKE